MQMFSRRSNQRQATKNQVNDVMVRCEDSTRVRQGMIVRHSVQFGVIVRYRATKSTVHNECTRLDGDRPQSDTQLTACS